MSGASGGRGRWRQCLGWAPLALPCLLAAYYMPAVMDHGFVHGDEGIAVMNGWRITLGEVPHADFFEIVPPFSFVITALAFKLVGVGFRAERILVLAYAVLLMLSSERLVRQFTGCRWARGVTVAFLGAFGVLYWPVPSHHWTAGIAQILAMTALLKGLRSRHPGFWGSLAGLMSAATVFSLQDQGGYFALALALLFFPAVESRPLRWRLFLGWLGGKLGLSVVLAFYLLPAVPLSELLYQWVLFPASRYREIPGNVGGLRQLGLHEVGSGAWWESLHRWPDYTIPHTFLMGFLLILPLVAVASLWLGGRSKWFSRPQVALLWCGVLAFLGGSLHRLAQTNLVWAAPMLVIVLAAHAGRARKLPERWKRATARTVLIVLMACSLIFPVGRVRRIDALGTVEVVGRAGALWVPARSTQSSMQLVIDAIERYVPPEATLFCTRYNPLISFWTQRRNPTRYNYFIYPEFHTADQVEEVITALHAQPDAHLLLFVPIDTRRRFESWALERYRVVWTAPWAILLAPKAD